MFAKWANEYRFIDFLIPTKEYRPFPKWNDRVAWMALDSKRRADIIERAQNRLNCVWPSLTATSFLEYYRTGARLPYETPHFARRRMLIELVLGECVEGNGRFVDDIVNGIWTICEETFWGVSAHNGVMHKTAIEHYRKTAPLPDIEDPYVDLFAAETAALLAWSAYLLDSKLDGVSPQIRRRISVELERRIKHPFLVRWDYWWMGFEKKAMNWDPWIISNVMSVFLLEEHDDNRRACAFIKMFDCLENFVNSYGADGGCDEGTSYWNRAGGSFCDSLELLISATNEKIDFFGEELVRQIGRFMYREHIAESYFINFADGAATASFSSELVYRYGKHIEDPKLMALALAAPPPVVQKGGSINENMWRSLAILFLSNSYYEAKRSGDTKYPYIRDTWMEDIQVLAAREVEGETKGLYLAAKGGNNDESHNHNDVGSIIVYVDGKPALIDVGVGIYRRQTFSEERYTIWTMQSGYHNLPTINGVMQKDGFEYHAQNVVCSIDDMSATLTLDIQAAYPSEAGVKGYRRESKLIRGNNAKIVVNDEYSFLADENELVLNLISWRKPIVNGDAFVVQVDDETSFRVRFDSVFQAKIEAIPTNDDRLGRVWGDTIYRVVLMANVGKSGKCGITVEKI